MGGQCWSQEAIGDVSRTSRNLNSRLFFQCALGRCELKVTAGQPQRSTHDTAPHPTQHINTGQLSASQHSIARYSTVLLPHSFLHSTGQQPPSPQYYHTSAARHVMTQHGTAHSTAQYSTTQHGTARYGSHGACIAQHSHSGAAIGSSHMMHHSTATTREHSTTTAQRKHNHSTALPQHS